MAVQEQYGLVAGGERAEAADGSTSEVEEPSLGRVKNVFFSSEA